jgi:ADP-heptose:LPS heptosyltransferase
MLRDFFPAAHITLVVGPWNQRTAEHLGLADTIVAYDFFRQNLRSGGSRTAGLRPLADILPGHFDLAIDLRLPVETRPLLRALSASHKAAVADRHAMPWIDIAVPPQPLKVRWSIAFRAAAHLRLPPAVRLLLDPSSGRRRDNLRPVEETLAGLVAAVGTALSGRDPVPRRPLADSAAPIVVAPISNSALRDWPPGRFGKLVARLSGLGSPVSLVGFAEHEETMQAIAAAARSEAPQPDRIAVATGLSGDAFAALLAGARLVVSNNSGAGHVAARMGVPTVGIYTASHLPEMWGFRGAFVSMLAARIACGGCGFDRPRHCPWQVRCKYVIGWEDVLAEVETLLAEVSRRAPPQAALAASA